MRVLRYKQKEDRLKFMGVNLPVSVKKYLTLYALANSVPQSVIIRELLEEWMEERVPAEDLVEKIAQTCREHWLQQKKSLRTPISKYKKELEAELTEKGIDKEYIDKILESLENGKDN